MTVKDGSDDGYSCVTDETSDAFELIEADGFVSGTRYDSIDDLADGTVGTYAAVGGNEGYVIVELPCTKTSAHYYASSIAVKFTNTIYTETKDGVTFSTTVPTSGNVLYSENTND